MGKTSVINYWGSHKGGSCKQMSMIFKKNTYYLPTFIRKLHSHKFRPLIDWWRLTFVKADVIYQNYHRTTKVFLRCGRKRVRSKIFLKCYPFSIDYHDNEFVNLFEVAYLFKVVGVYGTINNETKMSSKEIVASFWVGSCSCMRSIDFLFLYLM